MQISLPTPPAEVIGSINSLPSNPRLRNEVVLNPSNRNIVHSQSYAILSGYHDFRSRRKANLHFIAEELVKRGETSFISLRYSYLTKFRDDPRKDLWRRANKLEVHNRVDCFLWRTPIHAMRLPSWLALIERAAFATISCYLPREIREIILKTKTIFIESGVGIIYLPLIKKVNPYIQIIYMASDSLVAIKQAKYIKDSLRRNSSLIDGARVPSPYLKEDVPSNVPCFYIPHGIDEKIFADIGSSPFNPNSINAVSVGSMLFDVNFFEIAASLFPNIMFHAIGSGHSGEPPANVIYYPEMSFTRTLPFLKHCHFAIAPYGEGVEAYLTHTSMKLMQYDYLGLPAVCPTTVVGTGFCRFGYKIGDTPSIKTAIEEALCARRWSSGRHLTWEEVTARLLKPDEFEDTRIS